MASLVMIGSCSRCGSLWGPAFPSSSGSAVFWGGEVRDIGGIEDRSGFPVGMTSLTIVDVMVGRTAVDKVVSPVI